MSAAGAAGAPDPVPDLVEETRRVAAAVQDWLRHTADATADPAKGTTAEPSPPNENVDGHTGSDCDWCPICQFATSLRAEHPELAARIGEAARAMTGALRAVVDTALAVDLRADTDRPTPPGGTGAPTAKRPRPRPSRPDPQQPGNPT